MLFVFEEKKSNFKTQINLKNKHSMKKQSKTILYVATLSLLATACTTSGENDYQSGMEIFSGDYDSTGPDGGTGMERGDQFGEFADNPFVDASLQPVSTFSVDADGASYAIVRRYLTNGYKVNPSSVRIEEFLNYFTFNYAEPTDGQTLAINAEVGVCPWNAGHHLLRLGIKGKELTADEMPLANYVFLVDVSGSMNSKDKLELLKSGLKEMVYHLNPDDRIGLITYSGEVKKLLESTPVKEAATIVNAIDQLKASGYTNGGEALKMAYEEAIVNYDPKRNNRIILGTDGDFNFGVTGTEQLTEMVEGYAKKGIYLTCLGFGLGNLNDQMMESISNHGNGTYHYIDSEEEMMKVFVHERERFVSVANDVKCQVTFNADVVSQYRLIGYENRVMDQEDFADDAKDAGEIGAGQTITALYEVEMKDLTKISQVFDMDFATFDLRYKQSLDAESIPLQLTLKASEFFKNCIPSDDFYFAAGVATFGLVLRQSPYKGEATIDLARELLTLEHEEDPYNNRKTLTELIDLYKAE